MSLVRKIFDYELSKNVIAVSFVSIRSLPIGVFWSRMNPYGLGTTSQVYTK